MERAHSKDTVLSSQEHEQQQDETLDGDSQIPRDEGGHTDDRGTRVLAEDSYQIDDHDDVDVPETPLLHNEDNSTQDAVYDSHAAADENVAVLDECV